MQELLEFICAELESGRPVVSAVIVSSSGSTPRSTGSRMVMAMDGRSAGSVGGGPGEAMAQREAERAASCGAARMLKLDLTGNDAAQEGMICGGKQDILIEYIAPDEDNMRVFSDLLREMEKDSGGILCTAFRENSQAVEIISRVTDPCLARPVLPRALAEKIGDRTTATRLPFALSGDECTVLIEPMRSPGTAMILGAGHVGRATAKLAAEVGFITRVVDDRGDFLFPEYFPSSCRLHEIAGFSDCFNGFEPGGDTFVVILTRGHMHDKTVLAQALKTSAGYIGMIGSLKKRRAIYSALLEEGFSQNDLDRVHCPIGLDIGADTPQELAVSIVGELIRKRARDF